MKWYKYDIRGLGDEEYAYWYSLMTGDKKQRVDRFRFFDDKKRTVAGEMLARQAISEWCGVKPESIRFAVNENGKPYAVDLAVEFSISHSNTTVVCAIDNRPVGIDIEQMRPIDLSIAKHVCTEDELVYIFGYEPTKGDFIFTEDKELLTRFFEVWTTKEACGKQSSNGIAKFNRTTQLAFNVQTMTFGEYQIAIVHN